MRRNVRTYRAPATVPEVATMLQDVLLLPPEENPVPETCLGVLYTHAKLQPQLMAA